MEKIKIKREIYKPLVLQCIPCTRTQPAQCARHLGGLFKKRYCPNSQIHSHTFKTQTKPNIRLLACSQDKRCSCYFNSLVSSKRPHLHHLDQELHFIQSQANVWEQGCHVIYRSYMLGVDMCHHFYSVQSLLLLSSVVHVLRWTYEIPEPLVWNTIKYGTFV